MITQGLLLLIMFGVFGIVRTFTGDIEFHDSESSIKEELENLWNNQTTPHNQNYCICKSEECKCCDVYRDKNICLQLDPDPEGYGIRAILIIQDKKLGEIIIKGRRVVQFDFDVDEVFEHGNLIFKGYDMNLRVLENIFTTSVKLLVLIGKIPEYVSNIGTFTVDLQKACDVMPKDIDLQEYNASLVPCEKGQPAGEILALDLSESLETKSGIGGGGGGGGAGGASGKITGMTGASGGENIDMDMFKNIIPGGVGGGEILGMGGAGGAGGAGKQGKSGAGGGGIPGMDLLKNFIPGMGGKDGGGIPGMDLLKNFIPGMGGAGGGGIPGMDLLKNFIPGMGGAKGGGIYGMDMLNKFIPGMGGAGGGGKPGMGGAGGGGKPGSGGMSGMHGMNGMQGMGQNSMMHDTSRMSAMHGMGQNSMMHGSNGMSGMHGAGGAQGMQEQSGMSKWHDASQYSQQQYSIDKNPSLVINFVNSSSKSSSSRDSRNSNILNKGNYKKKTENSQFESETSNKESVENSHYKSENSHSKSENSQYNSENSHSKSENSQYNSELSNKKSKGNHEEKSENSHFKSETSHGKTIVSEESVVKTTNIQKSQVHHSQSTSEQSSSQINRGDLQGMKGKSSKRQDSIYEIPMVHIYIKDPPRAPKYLDQLAASNAIGAKYIQGLKNFPGYPDTMKTCSEDKYEGEKREEKDEDKYEGEEGKEKDEDLCEGEEGEEDDDDSELPKDDMVKLTKPENQMLLDIGEYPNVTGAIVNMWNSVDKPIFKHFCECEMFKSCKCCVPLIIPFILNKKLCLAFIFEERSLGISFILSLGDNIILEKVISLNDAPPICTFMKPPLNIVQLCIKFYDVAIRFLANEVIICAKVMPRVMNTPVLVIDLGCITLSAPRAWRIARHLSHLPQMNFLDVDSVIDKFTAIGEELLADDFGDVGMFANVLRYGVVHKAKNILADGNLENIHERIIAEITNLPTPYANGSCSCEFVYLCSCCAELGVPEFGFKARLCVLLLYLEVGPGMRFTLKFNKRVIIERDFGLIDPPPICANHPELLEFFDACFQFYDTELSLIAGEFFTCLQLMVRIREIPILVFDLGCITLQMNKFITDKINKVAHTVMTTDYRDPEAIKRSVQSVLNDTIAEEIRSVIAAGRYFAKKAVKVVSAVATGDIKEMTVTLIEEITSFPSLQVSQSCLCPSIYKCQCCVEVSIVEFEFNKTLCAIIEFVPDPPLLRFVFKLNNDKLLDEEQGLKEPPLFCINYPELFNYFDFCIMFNETKIIPHIPQFHSCLLLMIRLGSQKFTPIKIGCLTLPFTNGTVAKLKPGEIVPPGGSIQEEVVEKVPEVEEPSELKPKKKKCKKRPKGKPGQANPTKKEGMFQDVMKSIPGLHMIPGLKMLPDMLKMLGKVPELAKIPGNMPNMASSVQQKMPNMLQGLMNGPKGMLGGFMGMVPGLGGPKAFGPGAGGAG